MRQPRSARGRGGAESGRRRRLFFVLAVLAAAVAWGVGAGPARGQAPQGVDLTPTAEAWYHGKPEVPPEAEAPACTLPTGCPSVPVPDTAQMYPPETLHVGVSGGREESRAYVNFELTDVPGDATLLGGTLRLPLAGAEAGTRSVETAGVLACLVLDPFGDVRGSFDDPPEADCAISAPALIADGVVTVDLAGFALDWYPGGDAAVALVPGPEATGQTSAWHLAFHARGAEVPEGSRISARFEYEIEPEDDSGDDGGDGDVGLSDDDFVGSDGVGIDDPLVDPVDPPEAAAPQGDEEPIATVSEERTFFDEFAYPGVFAVPLLLIAGWLFFGRQFSQPVPLPVRVDNR